MGEGKREVDDVRLVSAGRGCGLWMREKWGGRWGGD